MVRPSRNELVEVVAAHAPEDLREPPVDLLGVLGRQPSSDAVARAFEILAGTSVLDLGLVERPQVHEAAVGEHDV